MKGSLFRRHFVLTAGMILISFALLAAAFMTLSYRYMVQEKKQAMETDITYVAHLAQNLLRDDAVPEEGFELYSPALSMVCDSDILLCDSSGTVLRYTTDGVDVANYEQEQISALVVEQLVSQGSYSSMTDLGIYDELYFVAGSLIDLDGPSGQQDSYLVLMTTSAGELVSLWRALATLFFFVAVVVLCIAFISSSIFSLQQIKPLRDLADAVRRFGMGDYDVRVEDLHRTDEIGDLATAFNAMADSLACSERRRQEFVANISHELKTPMTTISGFTNGILDGTIPPERVNDSLQVISSETDRLSRLVRRMLEVSSLQAKESVQSQVEFDISETMVQVMISLEGKIKGRQLDMDVHIPDTPVTVWGDPDGITQVCYNLLDNAAKFATPGTAIAVTISTKGPKAYISVKNQGETIPPDELNMIFDRFHKSDRSRSIDKEGVGLGLYIVKTILSNHKESISVTSKDGVTEFIFTLTLAG
jgi:signal transduction histidine kinase